MFLFSSFSSASYASEITEYDLCGIEVLEGEKLSNDKDLALLECFDKNKANHYESWMKNLSENLEDRVVEPSVALLSAIKIDNIRFGFPGDPRRPQNPPVKLTRIAKKVIRSLPKEIKNLIKDKFLGLVFIEDLGTSAYAPYTFKNDGTVYGGVIILDVSYLGKTANARQTEREATLFDKEDKTFDLKVFIAEKSDDDLYHAMQEVIIHEIGHIITYGNEKHVPLPGREINPNTINDYKFFDFNWKLKDGKPQLSDKLDSIMPFQNKLKFYKLNPPMKSTDMVSVYNGLNQSCFPSLYAARSYEEDFAETFVHYVRSFMLEKKYPYRVIVSQSGVEVMKSNSIWYRGKQCDRFKEYFDKMFSKF